MDKDFIGYLPWVGSEYEAQDHKILVLGESHHNEGRSATEPVTDDDARSTIKLTKEFVDGKWRHSFWSKVGGLVSRYMGWEDERGTHDIRGAFNKFAFYNFLTSSVSRHRDWPSGEAVRASRPMLIKVIDNLKPDFVIALGINKQSWFLKDIDGLDYINISSKPFVASRGKAVIVVCNHPQGRFSYSEAINLLSKGQELARARP